MKVFELMNLLDSCPTDMNLSVELDWIEGEIRGLQILKDRVLIKTCGARNEC